MIAEKEITKALRENATQLGPDAWSFSGMPHTEQEARRIVEGCLLLGQPVTDIVTSRAWLALVARVVVLQERVEALEGR